MDFKGPRISKRALGRLQWTKSSRSGPNCDNCVELATLPDGRIALRDSKNPQITPMIFTRAEIVAFLGGAGDGEFDHLLR